MGNIKKPKDLGAPAIRIFGLDGVLASTTGRAQPILSRVSRPDLYEEYDRLGTMCPPVREKAPGRMAYNFHKFAGSEIWVWSDRSVKHHEETVRWLRKYIDPEFPVHKLWLAPTVLHNVEELHNLWMALTPPEILNRVMSYHTSSDTVIMLSSRFPFNVDFKAVTCRD